MMLEHKVGEEHAQSLIESLDGDSIVNELLILAVIGGETLEPTDDHPIRVATNRLALSEHDMKAREDFIAPKMKAAGMRVMDDHPLALIGIYPGIDPTLEPVVLMSHIDTVPEGDIYDGTLGVVGAIAVVRAMNSLGIVSRRDIIVASLTGEESSRFGIALFGSRAIFHGLRDEELDSQQMSDVTIRQALGMDGVARTRHAIFGSNGEILSRPYAVLELHVEQGKRLADNNQAIDIGVVESIATAERYVATVGNTPLQPDKNIYGHERFFELNVRGVANHSGATPMGVANRADGLVETADFLSTLFEENGVGKYLAIGQLEVERAAMNKIPGNTKTYIRIASGSNEEVANCVAELQSQIESRNNLMSNTENPFPPDPINILEIDKSDAGVFFNPQHILGRQLAALKTIGIVHDVANKFADKDVVGTVGSYKTNAYGNIYLEIDIRGVDLWSRNAAVNRIQTIVGNVGSSGIDLGEKLAGSGTPPVKMDKELVDKAAYVIRKHAIGSTKVMYSAANHDVQNAALAGVPSVLIFCQSKDGLAHNPDAYTSPANIQKGVRSLGVLALTLANE